MYMYKECKISHKELLMGGMMKSSSVDPGVVPEEYQTLSQYHHAKKATLVWPPGPDPHGKSGCLAPPQARSVSPTSPGLAHWMSVMAEHPHVSSAHGGHAPHDVHYLWNGVETKMSTSEQSHGTPPLQKGYRVGPGGTLDDGRPTSLESSQLHAMYGNHGNRSSSSSSSSPPASAAAAAAAQAQAQAQASSVSVASGGVTTSLSSASGAMLVVPQPINAVAKPSPLSAGVSPSAAAGVPTSGRKYQCKMCPQIFMHKSAMQHHAREVHRGELKPHQCQQCLKSFSSNHQLVQHVRIHTGEKPYKCSYCDRRFKQLSHVQQHTRLHTGERPYKCHMPECGRAFIQLSNLQQHLRNHDSQHERTKNRPFHCNICGKGFATESSLRTHTSKQHAALIGGQNAQSCPVCHKMFLGPEALMDHMKTSHKDPNATGVSSKRRSASHPCPVCGKTYVNEGSLRKHIAGHPETATLASPLRMWPCSVCQSVFTQETGLLSHMEHMRMDPKHQFAAQYVLSRAAAERRERESVVAGSPGPQGPGGPHQGPPSGHPDSRRHDHQQANSPHHHQPQPPRPPQGMQLGSPQGHQGPPQGDGGSRHYVSDGFKLSAS